MVGKRRGQTCDDSAPRAEQQEDDGALWRAKHEPGEDGRLECRDGLVHVVQAVDVNPVAAPEAGVRDEVLDIDRADLELAPHNVFSEHVGYAVRREVRAEEGLCPCNDELPAGKQQPRCVGWGGNAQR